VLAGVNRGLFWGLEQGMLKRKESFSSISGEKTELL